MNREEKTEKLKGLCSDLEEHEKQDVMRMWDWLLSRTDGRIRFPYGVTWDDASGDAMIWFGPKGFSMSVIPRSDRCTLKYTDGHAWVSVEFRLSGIENCEAIDKIIEKCCE